MSTIKPTQTIFVLILISLSLIPLGCSDDITESTSTGTTDNTSTEIDDSPVEVDIQTIDDVMTLNQASHEETTDYTIDESAIVDISLNNTSISASSISTVDIAGTTATIHSPGTYRVKGTLIDGQLLVDTEDDAIVQIIFNGIDITSSKNAPFAVIKAEKVAIMLAEGSTNTLTDSGNYTFDDPEDDEPNAALYSKSDLTLYGDGVLTINANYNDGIGVKDGLLIKNGVYKINAVDDGIRGKDYLIVEDGTFTISSGGDGLKSDNDDDADRGYILVENGNFSITAAGDGLQAETDLLIAGITLNGTTGGGSSANISDDDSAKGLKAGVIVLIQDGDITLSSADDAIHSNNAIAISGGTFGLTTGDDGIHADTTLIIADGKITISKSYEGIESSSIVIAGGNIHVVSSDDGINGAGGASSPRSTTVTNTIAIKGGRVYVNATGDGIDVNGSMEMSGGVVIVDGPTSNNNAPLDYDQSFRITGGFLVAVGSSGMAQIPGSASTQNSVLVKFASSQTAGSLIHIQDAPGNSIITFAPAKQFQSLALSSAALATGTAYTVYVGGTSTGTSTDGLYEDGTYSPGAAKANFTISSVTTNLTVN